MENLEERDFQTFIKETKIMRDGCLKAFFGDLFGQISLHLFRGKVRVLLTLCEWE